MMSQVEEIPKTYEEAVRLLAQWSGEAGEDNLRIFSADDLGDKIVRLLIVSDELPDLGYVSVYTFGASDEFPFKTSTGLARPEQWEKIKEGDSLPGLPDDWKFLQRHQVWPQPKTARCND